MNGPLVHRIVVKNNATAVRERIERVLGVKTEANPVPSNMGGGWVIDFSTDGDVDFDFLRPDVLPPRKP